MWGGADLRDGQANRPPMVGVFRVAVVLPVGGEEHFRCRVCDAVELVSGQECVWALRTSCASCSVLATAGPRPPQIAPVPREPACRGSGRVPGTPLS